MTKLDKTFYGEHIAPPRKKQATRLTATLKAGVACAMLTMVVGTANAALSNADVTFNSVASDGFFGPVGLSDQNPDTIKNFANASNVGWNFGSSWDFLVRDNTGTTTAVYGGLTFMLSADNGQNGQPTPATWELTVTDDDLNTAPSIPFTMDFLIHMHGGNNDAFYFFDDRTINATNAGTFQINFVNNGNQFPGLSNFDILVRDLQNGGGGSEIPEPVSLLLFSVGLLGLGLNRRRKQA